MMAAASLMMRRLCSRYAVQVRVRGCVVQRDEGRTVHIPEACLANPPSLHAAATMQPPAGTTYALHASACNLPLRACPSLSMQPPPWTTSSSAPSSAKPPVSYSEADLDSGAYLLDTQPYAWFTPDEDRLVSACTCLWTRHLSRVIWGEVYIAISGAYLLDTQQTRGSCSTKTGW